MMIYRTFILLLLTNAAFSGNLDSDFDPIPGVEVSVGSIRLTSDFVPNTSIVQASVNTNLGAVSSYVHDPGGEIKLPKNAELTVLVNAAGNASETTVNELEDRTSLVITSQLNEGAEVSAVGDFQVSGRKNELRFVQSVGNKIVYQNKN